MGREFALVLLLAALFCSCLPGDQALIRPSYGMSFEGPALSLECVATLKNKGEEGLVESFRVKTRAERRVCLDQILQSLTPEPDFTTEDFERSLKPTGRGGYQLLPDPAIAKKMTNRIGVNVYAARGMAELARKHLIDDSFVIRPLVECLNHPLLDVGTYCNRALTDLTRHTYGQDFWERSLGAPPQTVDYRQHLVSDWTELNRLTRGYPIFDESMRSECLVAIQAIGARLIEALRPFGETVASSYLTRLVERPAIDSSSSEKIFSFDVGVHNTANWARTDRIARIAIVMSRPGISRPAGNATGFGLRLQLQAPDYRELFPALDLELRFQIDADEAVRQPAVLAVKEALKGLRDLEVQTSR